MLWQRSNVVYQERKSSCFFHAARSLGFLFNLLDFMEHKKLENCIDVFSEVLEYTGHTF